MSIAAIDHINVAAPWEALQACRDFYVGVLGLADGYRPPFATRGFWLYAGDVAIVHLTESAASPPSDSTGAFNHVAFACRGVSGIIESLDRTSTPYTLERVPDQDVVQIFVRDPAGVALELNFSTENDGAA